MIFKCLWLHFPFLSLFLYSQTLKADEVTVGSILLITALPLLFSSHTTVVAAGWVALQSFHEFQFSFGKSLLTNCPPQNGGKELLLGIAPFSQAQGLEESREVQQIRPVLAQAWPLPLNEWWGHILWAFNLLHPHQVWEDTDITLPNNAREEKNYNKPW